jgi:hypothetical protein
MAIAKEDDEEPHKNVAMHLDNGRDIADLMKVSHIEN